MLKVDSCLPRTSEHCWSTDCGSTHSIPGYVSTNSSLVVNVSMSTNSGSTRGLYYAKYSCFRHKCLNVHADFKRPWNFAHVCVSTPRRDLRGWFPFFFRRIYFWSKEVQISQISYNWPKGTQKKRPLGQVFVKAHTRRLQHFTVWFYQKLKNVSCEYDRLNGWNPTLQAAWYIRLVHWACLFYVSFKIYTCTVFVN